MKVTSKAGGHWTVGTSHGHWVAAHSELEARTDTGGPLTVTAPELEGLYVLMGEEDERAVDERDLECRRAAAGGPCDGTHRHRTGYVCAEHGLDGTPWSSNAALGDPNTPSQRRRD